MSKKELKLSELSSYCWSQTIVIENSWEKFSKVAQTRVENWSFSIS